MRGARGSGGEAARGHHPPPSESPHRRKSSPSFFGHPRISSPFPESSPVTIAPQPTPHPGPPPPPAGKAPVQKSRVTAGGLGDVHTGWAIRIPTSPSRGSFAQGVPSPPSQP